MRPEELARAKENLKGRIMLSMESTSNRMSRLGKSLITDTELLSIERIMAEIDAVEPEALAELAGVLLAPEKLSAAGIGPDEDRFLAAVEHVNPGLARRGVRVVLFGRGGKVGRVLAPALEAAGHELVELDEAEAMVDFTAPDAVEANVRAALEARRAVRGRHERAWTRRRGRRRPRATRACRCFVAPNFALGAVLMMRLAAEAARVPAARRDRRAAQRGEEGRAVRAPRGRPRSCCGGECRIHSVRLPGLVAHQEVLFGGDGQLLTIRHDTFSREAYVPGVLLALERLQSLPPGLTVGLDALLD